jgi:hypothetical protein
MDVLVGTEAKYEVDPVAVRLNIGALESVLDGV